MQFSKRVAFWVRYHRLKRQWSVQDACDRSGIARSTWYRLEDGEFSQMAGGWIDTLARSTWYRLEDGEFSQMAGGWIDTLAVTFGLDVSDLAAQIKQGGRKYVGVDAKAKRKRTDRQHRRASGRHPARPRAVGVRRATISKDRPR